MNFVKKTDRLIRDAILFIIDLLKFFPLKFIDLLIPSAASKKNHKEIFICKMDEIGDYLLFRNFLPYIKRSEKYQNYKVVFCGNIAWKNLAENIDKEYIDEFIWLNKTKFLSNLFYHYSELKKIAARVSEVSVNSSYSRNFYLDDTIISKINSPVKIGFKTDLSNSYRWQLKISDDYYSELIGTENIDFDFYKNKILFENLLKIQIPLTKPSIDADRIKSDFKIEGNFIVIFAGGRRKYKRWHIDNFVKLGKHLIEKYKIKIVLSGASSESKINESINNKINSIHSVIDAAGKTSLIDLMKVVSEARLLISNDSGIVHAAASVGTPVIVLANGTHFGRFLPYPEEIISNVTAIHPPAIMIKPKEVSDPDFKYRSLSDINTIDYETVKVEAERILNSKT